MASDSLSGFKSAVIFQKIRDPGRSERVRRIVSRQSSLFEASLEHVCSVGPDVELHLNRRHTLEGIHDLNAVIVVLKS